MSNDLEARNETINKSKLRNFLIDKYDLEQLKILCHDIQQQITGDGIDLKINFDDIGGERLSGKTHNLIEYLDKHGYLPYLMNVVYLEYPNVFKDTEKISLDQMAGENVTGIGRDDRQKPFEPQTKIKPKSGKTRTWIPIVIVCVVILIGIIMYIKNQPTTHQPVQVKPDKTEPMTTPIEPIKTDGKVIRILVSWNQNQATLSEPFYKTCQTMISDNVFL